VPAAFDKPEATYRIYQAFREWSGVKPSFHSDQPSVEVSALSGKAGGYAVITNHSASRQTITITASVALHSVARITPQGPTQVEVTDSTFKADIGPYEGAVFGWK
jgi:hypothetical protein